MTGGTCEYDGRGNVKKDLYSIPETFFFDAENRMVAFRTLAADAAGCTSTAGAGRTLYSYDAEGRRMKQESAGSGTIHFIYDVFGQLAAESGGLVSASRTQYLTTDHLVLI